MHTTMINTDENGKKERKRERERDKEIKIEPEQSM